MKHIKLFEEFPSLEDPKEDKKWEDEKLQFSQIIHKLKKKKGRKGEYSGGPEDE